MALVSAFNDSQATLVNVAPPVELVFTKNSVTNSALLRGRNVALVISTPDAAGAQTYIKDAYGQQLVAIRKHRFTDDTIKFANRYDSEKLKIKKWLLRGKLPTGQDSWRIDTPVGTYIWRTDVQTRLCLCHESDLGSPIAWQRPVSPRSGAPLAFYYKPSAEAFLDIILASFILLEQEMRMTEKRYQIADGMVADERGGITGNPIA